MSSYDQGRMDAWERIDALKRRLGLAGFFNEQKHKRYPKGHPKAGEFMPKPKEGKKPVPAKKIFNLNLSPVETEIDGYRFELEFSNRGDSVGIGFLVNGEYDSVDSMPAKTKRKAAFWWRRSAVNTLKMMPDGVPLQASAYNGDGRGLDRVDFYKSLGFYAKDFTVSGITKNGKVVPATLEELDLRRKPEVRSIEGKGKPQSPYLDYDDEDFDEDQLFEPAYRWR